MLKDSEAAASLVTSLNHKARFTGPLPFPKVQFRALPVSSGPFLASSESFAAIWSYKGKVVEMVKCLAAAGSCCGSLLQPGTLQVGHQDRAGHQDKAGMASWAEVESFCHHHSHVEPRAATPQTLK